MLRHIVRSKPNPIGVYVFGFIINRSLSAEIKA